MLKKILNSDEAIVTIEKGSNGRIFTKIILTEKIIINIKKNYLKK